VLCAIALIWALTDTQRNSSTSQGFSYQLPGARPFLPEGLALEKAKESLSKAVSDPGRWRPLENPVKRGTFAPDGTRDNYFIRLSPSNGMFLFESDQRTNKPWVVNVLLHRKTVHCDVSRSQ